MAKKNNNDRETLVNKYFISTPKKPFYLWNYFGMLAGVVVIAYALLQHNDYYNYSRPFISKQIMVVAGFILLLVSSVKFLSKRSAYIAAYNLAEPKATDKQMDDWLGEGVQMITDTALKRLDMDLDDLSDKKPFIIDGPHSKTYYVVRSNDNVFRYKIHDIVVFLLTEHSISTFQCTYDLALGEITDDKTKEFSFKDITNFETETSADSFYYINQKKTKVEGIKSFSIFTSGGNKISANYYFTKKGGNQENSSPIPEDKDEETIKAIRTRLKEYKNKFNTGLQN